ncbi:MAG TPA: antibiotic biosynthesis monooxygenase [Acidimicrobiales bacterium]|jgi:heme-degrading monooxygenase HmoA|nr:antibiotic biosynthesis monooxygenase [Acidimicrobiales bacterium]
MGDPDASPFAPGQVVTVFRSRLRPEALDEYGPRAAEMVALAKTMPGLVDVKGFTADDGERVTLVTFADAESQRAWREHPDHRRAQHDGRDRFYAEFSIQVCDCTRVQSFAAPAERPSRPDGRDAPVG